jgi:hypothetical protein
MTTHKDNQDTPTKHILRYVKGTLEYTIMYCRGEDFQLIGYKKLYWDGSIDDR